MASRTDERPNILLISVDQMRFDCLSYLGHPVVETPYLDSIASRGVCFTNAYSAVPVCIPARAAMMTGMSQRSHGRVGYADRVPWNYEHMLAGELANAGYHTQNVGKMHVYPTRNLCGFHNVVLHDGYMHYNRSKSTPVKESWESTDDYLVWLRERAGAGVDVIDNGLECNASAMERVWHLPEALHPTNWVVTQSIDFLRRRDPRKPFFLHMGFVRPHPPFDPPQAYFDRYMNEDFPMPVIGDWANTVDVERNGLLPTSRYGIVPPKRLKRAMAAYYALISHIDDQIGRFMQAMYEYGVDSNTIVLFTSDHGELLGDHNLLAKSLPYEGSAKIPFLLMDPGNYLGLKRGTYCDKVVELRDIMPTLLDIAGAPIPSTVDGESLLPLARGENGEGWRSYIHGEHYNVHYIATGTEKYVWYGQTGAQQYFDLVADPQELRNLIEAPEYAERIEHCRSQLIRELDGREEGYSDGKQLFAGKPMRASLSHIL